MRALGTRQGWHTVGAECVLTSVSDIATRPTAGDRVEAWEPEDEPAANGSAMASGEDSAFLLESSRSEAAQTYARCGGK